jgi:hypothetical protein
MSEKSLKNPNSFECKNCQYITHHKHDFKKHVMTAKHFKKQEINTLSTKSTEKSPQNMCYCICGKEYKERSGLWRHKKVCAFIPEPESEKKLMKAGHPEITGDIVLELIKQNQELKDMVFDLCKHTNAQIINNNSNNNITNNTTNNNKFNMNIFLNEKCKDAMNIMDFANSLEIGLKELEDVGTLGYAAGIGNIIVRGLKDLDVYKRPIHCSDLKRESIHVKDQNIWILDKDRSLLDTAIKRVARKNILKVKDWKTANPEYAEVNSKTMDKYGQILIEATGSFEPDEKEKDLNKIIRIIAKEVMIEK